MKTIKLMPLLTAGLLVVLLTSCGPSYVGVGTAPGYGYGPGYYGARPYYNYGYRPAYRRPVIVQRRTYVVPQSRYRGKPSYTPNARAGRYNNGGYRSNGPGNGRSRGPR
jgi:hypothetical protein